MSNLESIMKEINKEFKSEAVHRGVSKYDYERIPFTSPRLNFMTYGGIPIGMLIEFFGEEHGGKTTTALDVVANYQHMDGAKSVLYVDAENTLDAVWATKLGVDMDDMLILNPTAQGAETIFDAILRLIDTDEVGLVIIDSLGVMMSDQEYEKEVGEKTYGGISMGLTRFSKKAEMSCRAHNCTIIGINQMRADMNSPYGGTTTTGGKAWKHNVAVRMEFRQGKFFDEDYKDLPRGAESPTGMYIQTSMPKNKTCPPTRRTGFYTIRHEIGVDYLYDLLEMGIRYGIIDKSGAWYAILDPNTDEEIAKLQGRAAVYNYLEDEAHIDVLKMLEDFIDSKIKE